MDSRTKFYRDTVNGKWLGVCAGLADYLGIDIAWVRVGFVMGTIFGGGFPLPLYLVIAWVTERKPADFYHDDAEKAAFWTTARVAPKRSIRDVHGRFRDLDRRLRDIEAHAVTSNSRLAAEIDGLR